MPTPKKPEKRKTLAKRELIDTGTDKRYVRRDANGQFAESDDVGRSLAADRRTKAKAPAKAGQGDKGDRKPAQKPTAKKVTATKKPSAKKTSK